MFFFNDTATTEIYTLSLHDALPIFVVDSIDNDNLVLAARNVKAAKVVGPYGVNIYDVLYHEKLVMTRSAAEALQAQLGPEKKAAAADEHAAEENTQEEEAA